MVEFGINRDESVRWLRLISSFATTRPSVRSRLAPPNYFTFRLAVFDAFSSNLRDEKTASNSVQLQTEPGPWGTDMRRIGLNRCPYCCSSEVHVSSAKNFWDRIPVLALLRLVRCEECRRRHYRPLFCSAPQRPVRSAVPKKPSSVVSSEEKKRPA